MMTQLPDTRYTLLARLSDPCDVSAWAEVTETYEQAIYRYARSRVLQDSDAWGVVQQVLLTNLTEADHGPAVGSTAEDASAGHANVSKRRGATAPLRAVDGTRETVDGTLDIEARWHRPARAMYELWKEQASEMHRRLQELSDSDTESSPRYANAPHTTGWNGP